MGVPPCGVRERGSPPAVGVSLHGPTHVPPCLHWLLCKKAMGCAGVTMSHQDHEALPACPCSPSLWGGSHSVSIPCLTPAPPPRAPLVPAAGTRLGFKSCARLPGRSRGRIHGEQ